jgi:hypothetical protein
MNPGTEGAVNINDTWYKNARFAFKTWTGQETELGTLKTYTETRINFGNYHNDYYSYAENKGISLNFAWIQLGGLRVGKDESAFDTFSGYAGNVINDTLVPYGGFDTNVVQYYFDAGNGFSAVVSLEQGYGDFTIDSYVPHIVGGVKWTQGWGGVAAVVAYDSNWEEVTGKVRLDVNVSDAVSLWVMGGYGQDDNSGFGNNMYRMWAGNWAVWGGGTFKFNEKTSFNAQISYDEGKRLGIAANIAYDIVPGFTVTGEVDYFNDSDSDWRNKGDGFGGTIRFQRSF